MKIAINGMGRIGRAALKVILETPELELVAVNDIVSIENIVYLMKYDSVYGIYEKEVSHDAENLIIDGQKIKYNSLRNPEELPWKENNIDVVIESTGFFTAQEDAEKHINAGAKTVIISAPTKSENTPTVVHGVNSKDGKTNIFSCASCTTNNISPLTFVMERTVTVEEVNAILKEEAKTSRYQKVLDTTTEPIVSSDIVKSPIASTVDLSMTRVVDGDLLKVMTWYDNEWGFTNQMIRQILEI